MPVIGSDLTQAGIIPEATYPAKVTKIEYQRKTGEKWNKEGSTSITGAEFDALPNDNNRRFRVHLFIDGQGFHVEDVYLVKNDGTANKMADKTMASLFKAADLPIEKTGYNPDDLVNKQVLVKIVVKEDDYGIKNRAAGFYKV
jgi:hypothetical protein